MRKRIEKEAHFEARSLNFHDTELIFFNNVFTSYSIIWSEAAFPSLKFYKFKRFYGHYEILFKTKVTTDLKIEAYSFTMTSTNLMYDFLPPFYWRFNNKYPTSI